MGEEPDLDPDITRDFFERNILQLDASLLTENGIKSVPSSAFFLFFLYYSRLFAVVCHTMVRQPENAKCTRRCKCICLKCTSLCVCGGGGGGGDSVLVHRCGNCGLPEVVVMLTDENEYTSSFI